jgi:hypothetical protein
MINWEKSMKLSLVPSETAPSPGFLRSSMQMQTLPSSAASHYMERPPAFVYDPHDTGLGGGLTKGWTTPRTPMAYRRIESARSIGQRLIVDRAGSIILDHILSSHEQCTEQLQRFADRSTSLFHEDTDVTSTPDGYVSARLDEPWEKIDEPVLSLLSVEPSNYGSWLFRVLPKLIFRKYLDDNPKVLCWCPFPWQRQLLHFFGVADHDIIEVNLGSCYEIREVYVPVVLNPYAYLSEETMAFYQEVLASHNIDQRRDRLIYISRRSRAAAAGFNNVRHFIDESKLIEALQPLGFEIIEPETLSISEQARTFASAAMVVGASGAGMFNTAFCARGTGVVDIEAFPDWLYAHCNYMSSCGHTYGVAFGIADASDTSPTHKRWSIDVGGLMAKITQMKSLIGAG